MDADAKFDADEKTWNSKSTKLMLSLYMKYKTNFRNPTIRNKITWQNIIDEMGTQGIHGLSVNKIDRKFRNLKKTFRTIREKKMANGQAMQSKWQYYKDMERIFNDDLSLSSRDNTNIPDPQYAIFDFIKEENIFYDEDEEYDNETTAHVAASDFEESSKDSSLQMAPKSPQKREPLTKEFKCNEDLRGIRLALEKSNEIQKERNELFRKYIEHLTKK